MRKQPDAALDHGALRLLALWMLEQHAMCRNELCARLQSVCERVGCTAPSVPLVIEMLDCLGYVRTEGFVLAPTPDGLALLSAGRERAAEVIPPALCGDRFCPGARGD